MFHRLKITTDGAFAQFGGGDDRAFKRLSIATPEQAEKTPPVDPHSLQVLRDGVPRFLAPVATKRPPGRRVLWRKGDR